jgi:protein-L-isoaspartate O-methyltransferase
VLGDGRDGLPEHGPYDCIHAGAAFPEMPRHILQQLKVGGVFVAPVGTLSQTLVEVSFALLLLLLLLLLMMMMEYNHFHVKSQVTRVSETSFKERGLMGVRYVPMTSKELQLAKS